MLCVALRTPEALQQALLEVPVKQPSGRTLHGCENRASQKLGSRRNRREVHAGHGIKRNLTPMQYVCAGTEQLL